MAFLFEWTDDIEAAVAGDTEAEQAVEDEGRGRRDSQIAVPDSNQCGPIRLWHWTYLVASRQAL